MFTIETLFNHTLVTIVDDQNKHNDLEVKLYEDQVEIYQWDDDRNQYRTITISVDMLKELLESMSKPDGSYTRR